MGEPNGIILVEGPSDRIAVETVARRLGRDLAAEYVSVVALGGVHAITRHLKAYSELLAAGRVAGLYRGNLNGAAGI